jgi:hypothetical protein
VVSAPSSQNLTGREKARWTQEAFARLESYHAEHGTKKTAEQFGISDARVRQLMRQRKEAVEGQSRSAASPFYGLRTND